MENKRILSVIDRLEHVVKREFKKPEPKITQVNNIFDQLIQIIERLSRKGGITNVDKDELLRIIEIVRYKML